MGRLDEADRVREREIRWLHRLVAALVAVLVLGALTAILGGPAAVQAGAPGGAGRDRDRAMTGCVALLPGHGAKPTGWGLARARRRAGARPSWCAT